MTTRTTKKRTKKPGVTPYKLLVTLLYGHHKWLERDGGKVRFPCAIMSKHLKVPACRVQDYLYLLQDWGLLESVRWNRYWATIQISVPVDMEYRECDDNIGEVVDVQ
jgi:hypothetical protein